ncbi:MAG TPA: ATP-binding protein [Syntrophobacteria bacterium]|nr:ATP-binding protein [Syntrophobacteria bacterium]
MRRTTFTIRRRVIETFVFCLLSVLVFAVFSLKVHREIGHRLRLLELTSDLLYNILEVRRFEKNFFLYKQPASLDEAKSYLDRVKDLYQSHEAEILALKRDARAPAFYQGLLHYGDLLQQLWSRSSRGTLAASSHDLPQIEETLRNVGQELLSMTESWQREERVLIDRLSQRAIYLFFISMIVFVALGVLVAFYLARLFVRPMVQMQQAMEKISRGDFTPIPEAECRSEEFFSLFCAFNTMTNELQERQEQLLQSRKIAAIGTLTSGIAHELNNPINNIVLTAETLKEDFHELSEEEALSLVQDVLTQSERAAEVVRDLLDFSRSERPEFEAVAIPGLLNDTVKLVRNQLMLNGIELQQAIPVTLPTISGDRKSLRQAFLNLLINAIQAMPGGGTLWIRAYVPNEEPWLKVDVEDTGKGIAPEHLSRIFEPFFTTKEVGRGTGLGLSVTYGILEKHGGRIEVASVVGQGSTFTVSLPIKEEPAQAPGVS